MAIGNLLIGAVGDIHFHTRNEAIHYISHHSPYTERFHVPAGQKRGTKWREYCELEGESTCYLAYGARVVKALYRDRKKGTWEWRELGLEALRFGDAPTYPEWRRLSINGKGRFEKFFKLIIVFVK